jgi:hypothetical protein
MFAAKIDAPITTQPTFRPARKYSSDFLRRRVARAGQKANAKTATKYPATMVQSARLR